MKYFCVQPWKILLVLEVVFIANMRLARAWQPLLTCHWAHSKVLNVSMILFTHGPPRSTDIICAVTTDLLHQKIHVFARAEYLCTQLSLEFSYFLCQDSWRTFRIPDRKAQEGNVTPKEASGDCDGK
jgi:hypothetical protein